MYVSIGLDQILGCHVEIPQSGNVSHFLILFYDITYQQILSIRLILFSSQ